MTSSVFGNPRSIERFSWLLAVCLLAGGYFSTTHQYENMIAASKDRSQNYAEKIRVNREFIAQSGRIMHLREQLHVNLRDVLVGSRSSDTTAALLRDLDSLAREHGAQVLSVTPAYPMKNPGPRQPQLGSPGATTLEKSVMDLSVRGHFSDLLAFVARLPHRRTLLRVNDVQFALSSAQDRSKRPLLEAKIHTLLYRLIQPEFGGGL